MARQAYSRSERGTTFNRKVVADKRGIVAIRRLIDPSEHDNLTAAITPLIPEFGGAGNLYIPETLGVTVVGFSRYSKHHIQTGPATKDFVDSVPSIRDSNEILIGDPDVFGWGSNYKFGFHIDSPWLEEEIDGYEKALRIRGYPLNRYIGNPDGKYLPHLSIGKLYTDQIVGYLADPNNLQRLANLTGLVGKFVALQAYKAPQPDTIK